MSDTALIQIAWASIVICFIGLVIAISVLQDAINEYRISKPLGNGRFLYAKSVLRSQVLRSIKIVSLGAIAIVVISDIVENARLINVILFLVILLITCIDALLDRIVSHKITSHFIKKLDLED